MHSSRTRAPRDGVHAAGLEVPEDGNALVAVPLEVRHGVSHDFPGQQAAVPLLNRVHSRLEGIEVPISVRGSAHRRSDPTPGSDAPGPPLRVLASGWPPLAAHATTPLLRPLLPPNSTRAADLLPGTVLRGSAPLHAVTFFRV